jgi:perosamine synthetase
VKRLDWWTPALGEREKAALAAVVDSGFPNDGEVTTELERRIAARCGVPYAVATTSGTTALFLALAALGVGPGDEVLVPDVTFIASASAVTLTGARPVLVDVDPATLCMDPRAAAAALTPRTRAIMPVHVSGRAADLPALRALGLPIVEDAAEALGSRRFGAPLGAHGALGCFSFSPNKTITTGQGGMVVTRDAALHQRLRELKDQGRPARGTGGDDVHVSVGYNFKLTNLQAAVGLAQLDELDARLAHQVWLARAYRERLAGHPRLSLLPFELEAGEVPQWIDALVDGRDALHDLLREQGIHTRRFWHPLHTQAPYAASGFPVATAAAARALWLPSALSLDEADLDRVCELAWRWNP